jgi:hypothetical protein
MQIFIPQTEQTLIQFGPVKQYLESHKFDNSKAVKVVVCKWLQMQQTDCYSDVILMTSHLIFVTQGLFFTQHSSYLVPKFGYNHSFVFSSWVKNT